MEKRMKLVKPAGITKKDVSDALKEFYKTSLKPKFEQIDDQFEQVNSQLKEHTSQFGKIDKRFEQIDKRLDQHDKRFDQIDNRFEQIDNRFAQVDKKFQQMETQLVEFREDTLHQFHLVSEGLTSKVQQVAEGVINLNEKFDRRIDEIRKEMAENQQDVLAAIKFSYAELDRRISAVEAEMEALKRRMEILERRSVS